VHDAGGGNLNQPQPITPQKDDDELRAFLIVVHRSLRMITVFIEKKYQIGDEAPEKRKRAA
jgi:hypothetical protein